MFNAFTVAVENMGMLLATCQKRFLQSVFFVYRHGGDMEYLMKSKKALSSATAKLKLKKLCQVLIARIRMQSLGKGLLSESRIMNAMIDGLLQMLTRYGFTFF